MKIRSYRVVAAPACLLLTYICLEIYILFDMARIISDWNEAYTGVPPWDIGRPQPDFEAVLRNGEIGPGRVLDVGCGRGANAIMLAQAGLTVTGIDVASDALADARAGADASRLKASFIQGNVLELDRFFPEGAFDTIIDCGLFHVMEDDERPVYASQVHRVLRRGGGYFMMCFSDKQPGTDGPRRVSKSEIEGTFSGLFRINYIREAAFETRLEGGKRQAYLLSGTKA